MSEQASPRQRVWFKLRHGLTREAAFDAIAGLLLREKPHEASIQSLYLYPPGDGADTDPAAVTVMWELHYHLDESSGRDWDWGHGVSEVLAERIKARFSAEAD